MEGKIAVSISEAAEMVGISRSALYPRLMSGEVPTVVIGGRRVVPVAQLREWVDSQLADQMAKARFPS